MSELTVKEIKGKTHEYKRVGSVAYGRITTSEGEELWRARFPLTTRPTFDVPVTSCRNLDHFIEVVSAFMLEEDTMADKEGDKFMCATCKAFLDTTKEMSDE